MEFPCFEERLAVVVKSLPILYDKTLPDFKDKLKRQNAWSEVALKLGLPSGKWMTSFFWASHFLSICTLLNLEKTSSVSLAMQMLITLATDLVFFFFASGITKRKRQKPDSRTCGHVTPGKRGRSWFKPIWPASKDKTGAL